RALFAVVSILSAATFSVAENAAAHAAPESSAVFFAHNPLAITELNEDPAVTQRMVDQLVLACTGTKDVRAAWRSLVKPTARVGIKVSTPGGRFFSSHRGIIDAIVSGLAEAGIPNEHIIVWDRNAADLRAAGFVRQKGGFAVRSIEPVTGYDSDARIVEPVLGKLIWGDVLFRKEQRKSFR